MHKTPRIFLVYGFLIYLVFISEGYASPISIDRDGALIYNPDADGNVIPDFSSVGYQKSEQLIPTIESVISIAPIDGDNTQHIQHAINQLALLPLNADGFRGALLLEKGVYSVSGQLLITANGIVIRGVGQTEADTVIVAAGMEQRSLIVVKGDLSFSKKKALQEKISDAYVPVGARSFNVASTDNFYVGQPVIIYRPGTEQWINDIGMNKLPPRPDGRAVTQWSGDKYSFSFERKITAIDDNTISIDIPIVQMMQDKYGGGLIYPAQAKGRLNNIGIENMLLVSEFEEGKEDSDEAHAWIGINIIDTEHAWVSDITAKHFGYSLVSIQRGSRFITVRDSSNLDPVSLITGARRYSFNLVGSQVLFLRCYSRNGRHDFITGSRVTGPNAFVYSIAEQTHSDIGPHHRWAMGTLFDNVTGGQINIQDRSNSGSGHGWAGAQQVLWNTEASLRTVVQSPPGAINWSVGHIGPRWAGRMPSRSQGEWVSPGEKVLPVSLFVKQLEERIGVSHAAKVLRAKSTNHSIIPSAVDSTLSK